MKTLVKQQNIFSLLALLFISQIMLSCNKQDSNAPIDTSSTYKVKEIVFIEGGGCVTDNYPYYSLLYKSSFPNGEAETIKDNVELSFGVVNSVPKLISPADRVIFNLPVYDDALFSTFLTTSISKAQFDTLNTDYLFYNLSAGKYFIDITSNMNCIFFQSVNGNYGLIRINSVLASGLNNSVAIINFQVKYVEMN